MATTLRVNINLMLVPKVSNLDLGSGRKAVFREGGGEKGREKGINDISPLFPHDSIFFTIDDERGKGKCRLYDMFESRERPKRKLSFTDELRFSFSLSLLAFKMTILVIRYILFIFSSYVTVLFSL